jgi:hypothetical protein
MPPNTDNSDTWRFLVEWNRAWREVADQFETTSSDLVGEGVLDAILPGMVTAIAMAAALRHPEWAAAWVAAIGPLEHAAAEIVQDLPITLIDEEGD